MSMINTKDILETIKMIEEEHLDIRTITMGISLRDLAADDVNVLADKLFAEEVAPTMAIGVTEIRLLMIGIPSSRSICSPVATSFSARRVTLS